MLLFVCELEWALLLVVVVVIEVLLLVQTVDSMVIVGDFIQVYWLVLIALMKILLILSGTEKWTIEQWLIYKHFLKKKHEFVNKIYFSCIN